MPSARIYRAKHQHVRRVDFAQIKDNDFPTNRQKCDHDDRANLDSGVTPLGHHQKRFLEIQRDDHREDHAKYGLEDRVVRRAKATRENHPEKNFQLRFQTAAITMMAISAVRNMTTICSNCW